jgi:DNA topoisomerase-1
LDLFKLPRELGTYEGKEVLANVGRFGPYIKFGEAFVSMDRGESAMDVTFDRAVELIVEKQKADAPIAYYDNLEVTKGTGRFGPFIKWNGLFINVNKKYDFDALSSADIAELIELKKQKEIEKVVHDWSEAGVRIEKARWGRHIILKGKVKVELSKEVAVETMTLEQAEAILAQKAPKKKAAPKKKTTTKKTAAKKTAAKKTTTKKASAVKAKPKTTVKK